VTWSSKNVYNGVAAADGTFGITLTVPKNSRKGATVMVNAKGSSGDSAGAPFTTM
jgi:hypothetical protein